MNRHFRQILLLCVVAALCLGLPLSAEEYVLPQEQTGPSGQLVELEIPGVDTLRETVEEGISLTPEGGLSVPSPVLPGTGFTDYSGEWDAQTGLPVAQSQARSEDGFVTLAPGRMAYNKKNHTYQLYCGENFAISSLPAGAIVNRSNPLKLEADTGLSMELYRNGKAVPLSEEGYSEPGTYVVYLNDNTGNSVFFTFQLVDKYSNSIETIMLPETFQFTSVEVDGRGQTLQYTNYFELVVDGSYVFNWTCPLTGDSYTTRFILDRQPPALTLTQEKGNITRVSLSDLESGCYVVVSHGGREQIVSDPNTVISDPGRYTLTVIDQAGNRTTYKFNIKMYIDIKGGMAFALLLVLLLGTFLYSRRLRRNPRYY